jgi:hypothetical protein
VCTAYFRGFVASEAILKFSRWQIFWQGFLKQLLQLPKAPTVAVLMLWYAAPIAIKNSNGYSPFTLYDLSAENQDFPAIRRPTPPQMSMCDPVCVSHETKPLLSCKTPMSQFLYYRPAYGGCKSTSVLPTSYIHTLSLRGTDNPSSRKWKVLVRGNYRQAGRREKCLALEIFPSLPDGRKHLINSTLLFIISLYYEYSNRIHTDQPDNTERDC